VLPLLVNARGLLAEDAERLGAAYRFMRRLENFIQAIGDRQTHDLPADEIGRCRLCVAMNYPEWSALYADIGRHRSVIAAQFEKVAFRAQDEDTSFVSRAERAWESVSDPGTWVALFAEAGIDDPERLANILVSFANDAVVRQIDAVSRERLQQFIPRLAKEITLSDRPERALTRVLGIVERILRRSAYLSLLNENQPVLARLVDLCARSKYVAEQIARFPVLLDELLDPHLSPESISRADIDRDMQARLGGDDEDSEARMQAIAQFQRSTMFRIAIADFSDKLPIMKVSDGLTWLAEAVLEEALRVAWRDLAARHGEPCYTVNGKEHVAGFGIIAYGKLGGLELSYGSDLDIVFLHDSRGSRQMTDGEKPLDNGMFFGRLVRRLMHLLTMQTGSGQLYEIDTRLRPDGHKGLLVTNTDAFERYQEENAWTWEHQALLRARPVAGSMSIATEFERIRRETLVERVRRAQLRADVISMREKMRAELDRSDATHFDLKHGRGGIGDIEFLVQYLVLDNAGTHPDVIYYTDNIRQLDALAETGCIDAAVRDALQDAYRDYRLRHHHLVLDGQAPLVDPEDFEKQRRCVAETWDAWLG
jgi:glutamate-ammonia-ligase adenylyltransferase